LDLIISQENIDFRHEVRAFLNESLTPELRRAGERKTSYFPHVEASFIWQKILHDKGWLVPEWPLEHGGTNWTDEQRSIFLEECSLNNAPGLLPMGLGMLGPMLLKYGTDEQKAEILPRMLSGEDVWCQGYSEPGSGSDLASVQMRAVSDGDSYILNGSKIWTSFAMNSNKIFCLVRTNAEVKPQAGISFLLVDLDSPGVTVEPIVSMDGEVEQCQVFFDDVRAPKSNLVGAENQGWEVAKYLLEFERGGSSFSVYVEKMLASTKSIASEVTNFAGTPYREDPVFSTRLAELEIDNMALSFLEHRIKATAAAGGNPGALSSMQKLVGTELSQKVDELALELRGNYVAPLQNHVLEPSYEGPTVGPASGVHIMNHYLNNRASTIFGGTSEVQRNIISKLVLGL